MAAPLRKYSQTCLFNQIKQINSPIRLKYWEVGEDSLKEKGETVEDRTIGVPRKTKPHPETVFKGQLEFNPIKGKVYDKKPFPAHLKAGKQYFWCACGYSKHQPFCDGSHKRVFTALYQGRLEREGSDRAVKYEPVKFEVDEDGEYWLCNCKQSDNRPFCDGTHKRDHVQGARSTVQT